MGIRGHHVEEPTQEEKDRFLDLIEAGYSRPEAAQAVGHPNGRVFRAICNPASHRYDENFARVYHHLTMKGGDQETALAERLEDEAVRRALKSSDRLLEKALMVHHPDWAVLRPQSLHVGLTLNQLEMHLPQLSTETLEQMRRELEAQHAQKALPEGNGQPEHDVIEQ